MSTLQEHLKKLSYLKHAALVLYWDEEVSMPPQGISIRSATNGYLAGLCHQQITDPEFSLLLDEAKSALTDSHSAEAAMLRELSRDLEQARKLPEEFVVEMAEVSSEAHLIWQQARAASDFSMFLPQLKKIIQLKRKEAEYLGYKKSPYDALLDTYEPGLSTDEVSDLLTNLKNKLLPLIKKIRLATENTASKKIPALPIKGQKEFNLMVAKALGFNFESGRLDESTHPFTLGLHPQDVRITTRYSQEDPWQALGGTIHETGHALYEQGLPAEHFGDPLGEGVSLGIHESQSRIWENLVGRGKSFWQYFFPLLQKQFPGELNGWTKEEWYQAINHIKPSLIRVEADEVTYNLHIIIRFELERDLIEGKIEAEDLPKLWKQKIKEYLGIEVPSDAEGVLQDVHWSGGMVGYFPTYTLGNLYSAQLYMAAKKAIPSLEEEFAKGDFSSFLTWLRENIHCYGRQFRPFELIKKATGEPLKADYFTDYLEEKYGKL